MNYNKLLHSQSASDFTDPRLRDVEPRMHSSPPSRMDTILPIRHRVYHSCFLNLSSMNGTKPSVYYVYILRPYVKCALFRVRMYVQPVQKLKGTIAERETGTACERNQV